MSTWLDAARRFAAQRSIATAYLEALHCFAGPEPRGGPPPPAEQPWAGDFAAFERERLADSLESIAGSLCAEVDRGQAEIFARRLRAVDQALGELDDDVGRLLRVGLRQRARGILSATGPRATRIRALADFYYSHVGLHRHERSGVPGPPAERLAVEARWRTVAPGLEHATLKGRSAAGPLHVNLLRLRPERVRLRVEDCREVVARGEDFARHAERRGALAAVSGGFFLYSEPDITEPSRRYDPVGLLMDAGAVLSPPALGRSSLLLDAAGRPSIARIGPRDLHIQAPGGQRWRPDAAYNRASGRWGPDILCAAIVGHTVVAVGRSLAIPLNGFVTPLPPASALREGDRVEYPRVDGPAGPIYAGIAGGPRLLHDGKPGLEMRAEDFWGSAPPVTFSQDETGDRNRLPRLAAGLTPDGVLVLAAVDGRNLDRALGMTLGEVARLLLALGCRTATNLDGGSSKRMVLEGQTLDLPSTEIVADGRAAPSVRPVHTGLLIFARG